MKIGLIQLDAGDDVAANLDHAEALVVEAAGRGAGFVVLPEVMHLRVGPAMAGRYLEHAEPVPGPMTQRFGGLAKRLNIHLLMGSIGEACGDAQRIFNTSVLLGPDGGEIARYRKVHLFDVSVDAQAGDRESERYLAGDQCVVAATSACRVGLSICYDLRFPELYRALALAGARVVFVPANFTRRTGAAHWMTLLRARAIENGVFVVAPAQCGAFPGGFEAFGHSAVIDPWGRVLEERDDRPGVSVVELDLEEVGRVRAKVPTLDHLRPEVYRRGAASGGGTPI